MSVGRAGFPVLCVDDFLDTPEQLIELAADTGFIDAGPVYPGVRAPAPWAYVQALLDALTDPVTQLFGSPPDADVELCAFSMVTTPPARLRTVQRIPHFDGPQPTRIAWLHYLCAPQQGGTSFYRHLHTGLERVTEGELPVYRARLREEMSGDGFATGYASGATPYFERIHSVGAAFNRLVLYPGNALHSGDIGAATVFSEDPRLGRLTINGFAFLRS